VFETWLLLTVAAQAFFIIMREYGRYRARKLRGRLSELDRLQLNSQAEVITRLRMALVELTQEFNEHYIHHPCPPDCPHGLANAVRKEAAKPKPQAP
jgi:hypothetical protein